REVASIGAGHAATALGTLVHRTILASVPRIALVPCHEVAREVGAAHDPELCAVHMGVHGDVLADSLVVLHATDAHALCGVLLGRQSGHDARLDLIERSAVQECANILAGAYLNALAEVTQRRLLPSPPVLHVGPATAALEAALAGTTCPGGTVLCVESELRVRDGAEPLRTWFLLVPSPTSVHEILGALGFA
ncbi:MAG: chemotaxis protein CheC, partial [Gemmatimonadaceae bacterium]|nr:chemotaxis protein CheC [Gemmatimonadaceae bacterium]